MNRINGVSMVPLLLAGPCWAQCLPVSASIGYDGGSSTNPIVLTWAAIPTKQYNVMTTTALGQQPWQVLNPSPLVSPRNLMRWGDRNDRAARFYKVVKLDTDPPEIWRRSPADGAIAVSRRSPLTVYLRDETGIDASSVVLNVGTNPPVTLTDTRLAYRQGVLTYRSGTNEFLGDYSDTVVFTLAVSDTLGNRGTNTWSFQLEWQTILADNVVLISGPAGFAPCDINSYGLTLMSTQGDLYVFSYAGSSSGLAYGQVLVSADASFPYKRKIMSLTDDPIGHTVSLVTTQASLAECFQQASIRLAGDFSPPSAEAGVGPRLPASAPGSASIPLDGTVLYDNGTNRMEAVSGQITFAPDFTVAGTFQDGRLIAFDSDVAGTVGLDLTLQGNFQTTGDFDGSQPLRTPIRTLQVLGFAGCVPIWVEADLEFNLGYEAHLEASGPFTAGFTSSRTLALGVQFRNRQWNRYEHQISTVAPFTLDSQTNGSARVQGYVEPKLTVFLESLAGPSADLKPYLELDGAACLPPGQVGADLSLYAGLNGTLTMAASGWDLAWVHLPSWQLFNLREVISQKNLAKPVGSPPQIIANLVWIPCGAFTMGSPASEAETCSCETPQTRVSLSHGFWMGKYEVTQGEYLSVMSNNPSWFNGLRYSPGLDENVDYGADLSRPVEQVSWTDAVAYCAALTQREQQSGRLPAGYVYRLPTEAEWEYACRAGTTTAFYFGPALRSGMANFNGRYESDALVGTSSNPNGVYLEQTVPAGSYAPNAWGLYDMPGNVWEWCGTGFGSYPGGSVTDPQGPATGASRVLRGGGWNRFARYCRSADRSDYASSYKDFAIGFRIVLAPSLP